MLNTATQATNNRPKHFSTAYLFTCVLLMTNKAGDARKQPLLLTTIWCTLALYGSSTQLVTGVVYGRMVVWLYPHHGTSNGLQHSRHIPV